MLYHPERNVSRKVFCTEPKVFSVIQVHYSELFVKKLCKIHNKNVIKGNFNIFSFEMNLQAH